MFAGRLSLANDHIFFCKVPAAKKTVLHEGAAYAWMTLSQIAELKLGREPGSAGLSRGQNFRRMLTSLIGQKSPIGGSRPAVRWIGWK